MMTPRTKKKSADEQRADDAYPWEQAVGYLPWKVTVYEEPSRKGTLYLRWRQDGNWRKQSLRRTLTRERGIIAPAEKAWAIAHADATYARLMAGVPAAERMPTAPLTIRQGLALVTDRDTGKYSTDTPHRREVVRELERAMVEWGASTPWADIRRAHLRTLWRRRIRQLRADDATGLRGAEITVQRVLAVAAWLRDEEKIPAGACLAARTWKDELRSDWLQETKEASLPEPDRPRHSLAEMRAIMAAASAVDPRFELAMVLGAELRLGQVIRCRRPHLSLEHATLTVPGKGHKKGAVAHLTAGQMRVVQRVLTEGYLADLERALPDYPLFPAGQLTGGRSGKGRAHVVRHGTAPALSRATLDGWFHEAERLAAGISREGLQQHGGWSDSQMPDKVYADQAAGYARDEARDVRARIRGEEG